MKIISLIDDSNIIKKILKHLGLWEVKRKPPPRAKGPPTEAIIIYDESSSPSADDYLTPLEAGSFDLVVRPRGSRREALDRLPD